MSVNHMAGADRKDASLQAYDEVDADRDSGTSTGPKDQRRQSDRSQQGRGAVAAQYAAWRGRRMTEISDEHDLTDQRDPSGRRREWEMGHAEREQ